MRGILPLCLLGIAAAFVLPTLAAAAQAAIPFFAFVIACVVIWRLAFPPKARRR